jgi:hypothetical protein
MTDGLELGSKAVTPQKFEPANHDKSRKDCGAEDNF